MAGDRGAVDFFAVQAGSEPEARDGEQRRWPASKPVAAGAHETTARRRLLSCLAAVGCALLTGGASLAQTSASAGGPTWKQLSPQQREALAPLADQWESLPADSKHKWLEIADKYRRLSPDGKAKMQSRMADFARLTPEQRQTARENFQRAYELPLENRESAVQQYQQLPEEKKKQLGEQRTPRKDAVRPAMEKK